MDVVFVLDDVSTMAEIGDESLGELEDDEDEFSDAETNADD